MGVRPGRHTRERGFTLIELTVALAVIVTLALILTPSIADYINDSKVTRARSDATTIARAIVQFYADNGFFPLWIQAQDGGPGLPTSRLDLLVSPGNVPALADESQLALAMTPVNWTTGRAGLLADQLLTDTPAYALKTPATQFGWNGPYLSAPIGPDPWSNRYTVNIGLVEAGLGIQEPTGTVKRAVWVISAGPNGVIDTPFSQPITNTTSPAGDDIGIRIQ